MLGFAAAGAAGLLGSLEGGSVAVRNRSPRITASAWITVLPPRMMCCVPWIWDRREILFPVSCFFFLVVRLGFFCLGWVGRFGVN